MRAAAILGLGTSTQELEPFQKSCDAQWRVGMPGSASEADAVLVFGGDGTIHRHLARLVALGLPVLVVPKGSGNDFARAIGIKRLADSLAAWKKLAAGAGRVKAIDLGVITPLRSQDPPSESSTGVDTPRYFCCVGGVGLDGEIARRANQLPRWLRGNGGYAMSLPPAVFAYKQQRVKVMAADSEAADLTSRADGRMLLAVFANTPVYGGGMRVAPRALMDDGLLDVCLVHEVGRLRLLRLFPKVYSGNHLTVPEVQYFQSQRLRIETETPQAVYADGEYVCRTPIEVCTSPGALRIVINE